ncbi:MAG: hypothetical protein MUP82_01995 [Candidatus Marinimicrobia bacterium]|nr:hypothetical protein [Candidatus Neomarinimicrobiota bacterium]
MAAFNVTDCLILKLEENDTEKDRLDNTIFILYDTKEQTYIIRGQRECGAARRGCTYSYTCENEHDLADYLQYMICSRNTVNEILYNYDNLPSNSNDITFEKLYEDDELYYEISGYNGKKLSRARLIKNLRMLRNVFNYYN